MDDSGVEQTLVPSRPSENPVGAAPSLVGRMAGQFKLVRELGRGGMGTVYLGEHVLIGSRVAVKVLHPHLARDPVGVERFFAEARAVNLIGHENIVRIFDMDQLASGEWFLVMEYLIGQPLSELAQKPFAERTCRSILVQVLDALDAAHARAIVHRDVKPENIFVTPRADGSMRARLLDFGIARFFSATSGSKTKPGAVLGTPAYMAPEQWEGSHVDARADVYAVGVMGWVLATGMNPFAELGLSGLFAERPALPVPENLTLSAGLRAVLTRAMAPRREDRFQSAAEMKEALQALEGTSGSHPTAQKTMVFGGGTATPRTLTPPPKPAPGVFPVALTYAGAVRQLTCEDLSRAGAFIRCDRDLPPLRSLVSVAVTLPGGTLVSRAEVVRHVTAQEARSWSMSPGVAVQFLEAGRTFADRLTRLLSDAPAKQEREDLTAASRIRSLAARLGSNPYTLLDVPLDASFPDIRRKARSLVEEVLQLSSTELSSDSRARLLRVQEQVQSAAWVLGDLLRRAEYDARHGNHRGVARCLSAGLTVTDAEKLRAEWLKEHGRDAGRARLHRITGDLQASQGNIAAAKSEYEKALANDPLEITLHQAFAGLSRRLASGA